LCRCRVTFEFAYDFELIAASVRFDADFKRPGKSGKGQGYSTSRMRAYTDGAHANRERKAAADDWAERCVDRLL
jgi:hypothetical protein